MVEYKSIARTHGVPISQTLDSPIRFMDMWELNDVMMALGSILVFGVIFYSWWIMMLTLLWCLVIAPKIKDTHNRGILLHYPYRKFGMKLIGLVNPGKCKVYSD